MARVTLDNIQEITDRANVDLATAITEASSQLAQNIVEETPVDTGFLRANWFFTVNDAPWGRDAARNPGGTHGGGPDMGALAGFKAGDTIYFANSAAYAAAVEFGTSRMAPRAMVRRSSNRARSIVEAVVQRIAAGG